MRSDLAVLAILSANAQEIALHLVGFLRAPDTEGPHKLRVALRRLTTALDAFPGLLRRAEVRATRRRAKAMFRHLGKLRDGEVYLAALPAKRRSKTLVAEQAALSRATLAEINTPGMADFGATLQRKLTNGGLLRRGAKARDLGSLPVADLAGQTLAAAFAAARQHGKIIAKMDADTRHEFRKALKSLRYLSEFFAPLWPAAAAGPLHADLAGLQDELGLLNDRANLRRRAGKTGPVSKAERAALTRADLHWQSLRRSAPWWQVAPAGDQAER